MSLNDTQIQGLQNLYNDESLGLTTEKKLYDYLKTNGETGQKQPLSESLAGHLFYYIIIF
jgi:hypothetical protein